MNIYKVFGAIGSVKTAPLHQTVYRRKIPPNLITLGSKQGQQLFKESLLSGNAQAFFPLIQNLVTQSEPFTCGATVMSMLLNALQVDPQVNWKGIWRWYDDWNIKHFKYDTFDTKGINLQEFH